MILFGQIFRWRGKILPPPKILPIGVLSTARERIGILDAKKLRFSYHNNFCVKDSGRALIIPNVVYASVSLRDPDETLRRIASFGKNFCSFYL